jgi:S1-C subfamily serine protease
MARVPVVAEQLRASVVSVLTSEGLGSGVVWSADGTIVTDRHVVGDAVTVQVAFADGQRIDATVRASDPVTDLAVLETGRSGLVPAEFEDVPPSPGDLAVAVGSPLGFTNSVTAGVISGLGRSIPGSASRTQSLVDLIQTDAAISPGNSGGALADGDGRVVGIAEAYIPPSAGAVSIGFAIPSATVRDTVEQLLARGVVRHAYLGLVPGDVTPSLQERLGLDRDRGVVVLDVTAGGPADAAGIAPGDLVVGIDSRPVDTAEDLLAALRMLEPGQTVPVELVRAGQEQTVQVTVSQRPS